MLFVGKWMELEIIMLSEIRQTVVKNIIYFPSYAESRPKNNQMSGV
jgi:hypothetical protein